MCFSSHDLSLWLFFYTSKYKFVSLYKPKKYLIMVLADITYTITANVNETKIVFVDTTDYTALSATVVTGILKVTDPLGNILYENAGYATDDFSSPDIDVTGAILSKGVIMELTSDDAIIRGDYIVAYKVQATVAATPAIYTTGETVKYCFTPNDVDISIVADCDAATLTSTDNTDYIAVSNGDYLSTYTLTRTHGLVAPAGSSYGAIADSTDAERTLTDIWTRIWQSTISTIAIYTVSDNFFIQYTYEGSDNIDVRCDGCACDISQCIRNVYDRYIVALGKSRLLAEELAQVILQLTALYTQYLQAERCGSDTSDICQDIKDILSANDCTCSTQDDDKSIPVVSTHDTFAGSKIFIETTDPTSTDGDNTDIWFNSTSWDVFQKTGGSWVNTGNIKGATGAKGDTNYSGLLKFDIDLADLPNMISAIYNNTGATWTIQSIEAVLTTARTSSGEATISISKGAASPVQMFAITIPTTAAAGVVITGSQTGADSVDATEILSVLSSDTSITGRVTITIWYE